MSEHRAERFDVAIVGGGLAGLACALALRQSGLSVGIFERDAKLGGRAGSATDPTTGDGIDIGPHILLSEYRNMLHMLRQLGTENDVLWQTDRFVTLLDDEPVAMRVDPLPAPLHLLPSILRIRNLSLRDKVSNSRITWLAMRMREGDMLQLDDVSAGTLLDRCGVSLAFRRWFWATATLALLNVPLEQCSAAALLRVYGRLIGRSGYRSGFARKPLADLFVPSARKLLTDSSTSISMASPVTRIGVRNSHVESITLADGRTIQTDVCVVAVPPDNLLSLLAESGLLTDRWQAQLSRFRPSPYISTYLWLDRKVTQARFWSRVWSPHDLNCDFYDLSNIRDDVDAARSVIASNCIYSVAHDHLTDRQIVDRTFDELSEFAPSAASARIVHAVVNRIPFAIATPAVATECARPETATSINGLLLAGDWTDTHLPSCMESAVYSGRRAAEHILNGEPCDSPALAPAEATGLVKLLRSFAPQRGAKLSRALE